VVSRCLSAAGIRFSVILFPPGSWALLTVGLPDHSPDPDGVTTFRTHELRSGWAPSVPRRQRCSPRTGPLPGRRLPHRNGMSLSPPYVPSTRLRITRHQPRVHTCSPVRSSPACGRPDGTGRPWAFPGLRTPPAKSRTTHARAGTGHRARTWNYTLNSSSVDLQSDSSLVTCDLVSQVA
jgi:hypothetical protein